MGGSTSQSTKTHTTGHPRAQFPLGATCGFLLPLIIIFPLFMGIDGVMYAGPIADAAAFVLAIVFARRELAKMRRAEVI